VLPQISCILRSTVTPRQVASASHPVWLVSFWF
jgi:hypothetical protein